MKGKGCVDAVNRTPHPDNCQMSAASRHSQVNGTKS
jgi:hypothetical protein